MTDEERRRFSAAIRTANGAGDKDALRRIVRELISRYGLAARGVTDLLRQVRFPR